MFIFDHILFIMCLRGTMRHRKVCWDGDGNRNGKKTCGDGVGVEDNVCADGVGLRTVLWERDGDGDERLSPFSSQLRSRERPS